ncbi:hypothetical protein PILCRDRAFT_404482 [Piloderma croceum F 1598]|uniref:Uncharacterized protein n=1 Tax=Piloderma croceum (strain F 1598) TaxID=765440 RepID=A0A0C3G0P0_PILCF|nr:hypothetical protein PILCRDRAFT_404482 [Piloderma croceum F 1598]
MSVAGGVAFIGIIGFFVWKFTRKRFSDYDDNEAIKWPELNSHGGESVSGHALPTHATGRAGFGDDGESTVGGYASSLATTSTPELYPGAAPDPYAVPPLPHLNPNQPYHDEPARYGRDPNSFYDPYKGPVPSTFNDAGPEAAQAQGYGAEAIPMTQMARTRSPGPQMGYDTAPQPGRQSPGPSLSYGNQMMEAPGRQASPGPYAAYGGR